jgi:hypothetical protein
MSIHISIFYLRPNIISLNSQCGYIIDTFKHKFGLKLDDGWVKMEHWLLISGVRLLCTWVCQPHHIRTLIVNINYVPYQRVFSAKILIKALNFFLSGFVRIVKDNPTSILFKLIFCRKASLSLFFRRRFLLYCACLHRNVSFESFYVLKKYMSRLNPLRRFKDLFIQKIDSGKRLYFMLCFLMLPTKKTYFETGLCWFIRTF